MRPLGKSFLFEKWAIISLSFATLIGGIIFGYITSEIKNFSGVQNLRQFQPAIPTKLYDVNGELISELFQEKRDLVSYDELPKCLINAFIATEDQQFFEHFGLNPSAIGRAAIKNVAALKIVQGGSTITQQLAKRLFTKSEKRLTRKILEAILAMQIEKRFSKDEILEMYFNQIYLGHGCYGISSAADLYFGKKVKYLTVAESSVLAALPSAPEDLSPLKDTHAAYEKNRDTLNRMVRENYLTKEKSDKLYQEFWPSYVESIRTEFPTKTVHSKNNNNAPHFTDYVRQILISRFGKDAVYNEGLSIFTTLDLKRQQVAEKYLYEGVEKQDKISSQSNKYASGMVDRSLFNTYYFLRSIFPLPSTTVNKTEEEVKKIRAQNYLTENIIDESEILMFITDLKQNSVYEKFRGGVASRLSSSLKVEGAFLAIEPKTGYITSMVGGSSFEVNNQYNRATQAHRQPGSSFKPFVYGAGIDSKIINAGSALPDAPIVDIDATGETWAPGNYEGDFSGLVRLRMALMKSINIISVRIYDAIGADRIINFASRMLKVSPSRFTPTPSLALGSTEMTPFEMATGYAIYANRGRDVIPYAIRYITDRDGNEMTNIEEEVGNIIAIKEREGSIQVISEETAFVMTSLMQSVAESGTASYGIRQLADFRKKCAGKTGTTSNWTDAWFCGFTPDIAAVVWIGYDKPFLSLGKHQAGASVAAPIWGYYMKEAYNGMKDPEFPSAPLGVTMGGVCSYSGQAPGSTCTIAGEYMIKGGYPSQKCDGNHQKMQSVLERYMEQEGITSGNE